MKAINLRPKDTVVSAFYANKEDDFLLLSTRYTLKRMRVTDIVITRRARAGSTMIKPVKTNPIYLVDAAKMTPNQFRENVKVDIRYLNGNDGIEARSLKYNVSDTGRSIQIDGLTKPEALWLPKPTKPDDIVSGDYLIEERQTLFNLDDGAENEKPLVSSKKQDNILDELDKILATEFQNASKEKELEDELPSQAPVQSVHSSKKVESPKSSPLNLWDLPLEESKEEIAKEENEDSVQENTPQVFTDFPSEEPIEEPESFEEDFLEEQEDSLQEPQDILVEEVLEEPISFEEDFLEEQEDSLQEPQNILVEEVLEEPIEDP
ncbi:MAG: hypothetical protein K2F56_05075, partial [Anaeroplasmataceae bacterium]|nr:hypothetical protein [Anaeroplasmataceae bacterium]